MTQPCPGRTFVCRFAGRWVGVGPVERFGLAEADLLPGVRLGWIVLSWCRGGLREALADAVEDAVARVRRRLGGGE